MICPKAVEILFMRQLTEEQKELTVKLIRSFVSPKDSGFRIHIEHYNEEIAEAMNETKNGNDITRGDLEKESSLW